MALVVLVPKAASRVARGVASSAWVGGSSKRGGCHQKGETTSHEGERRGRRWGGGGLTGEGLKTQPPFASGELQHPLLSLFFSSRYPSTTGAFLS